MSTQGQEEVGDLFITEQQIMLRLLPSNKSASKRISWFAEGCVTDHATAAQDIAALVERVKGRSRVVRGLTLMTDRGMHFDTTKSGLKKVIVKAGYQIIN